jgi:hypothetical protein
LSNWIDNYVERAAATKTAKSAVGGGKIFAKIDRRQIK